MAPVHIVVVMCALVVAIIESRELVLVSTYPDSDNFSYIELVCVYGSGQSNVTQSVVIGASFQLNGTDIEEEIDSVETLNNTVRFLLTQEKEGFFTCLLNGLRSSNFIVLAAQPSTNYSGVLQIHDVQLLDADSIVSTVLECDIQPGALRQSYSVLWKQLQHNETSHIINDNGFNLTLSVNYSVDGSQYQCEVTIDHDGEGVSMTYEGRTIIIRGYSNLVLIYVVFIIILFYCTLIMQWRLTKRKHDKVENSGLVIGLICVQVVLLLPLIAVLAIIMLLVFLVIVCPLYLLNCCIQYILDVRKQRRYNQLLRSLRGPSLDNTAQKITYNIQQQTIEMELKSSDTLPRDHFQDRDDVDDSHTQQDSQQTSMVYNNAPPPYPGPPIIPHTRTEYIPEWFEPVTTPVQCTHLCNSYHDEANDLANAGSQSLQKNQLLLPNGLPSFLSQSSQSSQPDNPVLLTSSNPPTEWEQCSPISDQQNDFRVSVSSEESVAGETADDSLPVESELPIITDVQEVAQPLSKAFWLTSLDTAIRQGMVKSKSRCEGRETELNGRELEEGMEQDGMEDYAALTHDTVNLPQYAMEQSMPLPTSGLPTDPHSVTKYMPEWPSPVAAQLDFTHHGTSYHDIANEAVLQRQQKNLFLLPDDISPSCNPHTGCEQCNPLFNEQHDFRVNTSGANVVGEMVDDSLTLSYIHEGTLSESWPTSSGAAIELEKGKELSGYEGSENKMDGGGESRGEMVEYAAQTCSSLSQHGYEIEYPNRLLISGPPIDTFNTREYIPKWFSPVATLLQCTHDGRHYYDETNDFSLEIPEGAIPEGETITIDIGVALYGPFQYPEGLRPVSPVFWLCVRDMQNFHFAKSVTVTIPHFLNLKIHADIESPDLTLLKGDHELNSQQLHQFQKAERESFVEPVQKYGVVQITHFCSLCISSQISRKLAEREVFCLSAVTPHTFSLTQPSHAYFYITYMLSTCLRTVREQIQNIPDLGVHEKIFQDFQFSRNGEHQFLEIALPQSPPNWTVGLQFRTKFNKSDIDFFPGDHELLKLKEQEGTYPPRFRVIFTCTPTAKQSQASIKFRGAVNDLVFDVPLNPPPAPPQATPTSPLSPTSPTISSIGYGSISSNNSLVDQYTPLGIEDLTDVKSKILPVAARWRDIGLVLGISDSELETIEANKLDIKDRLTDMLRLWLKKAYRVDKYGEPSWGKLRDAVSSPSGGNDPAVADEIYHNITSS